MLTVNLNGRVIDVLQEALTYGHPVYDPKEIAMTWLDIFKNNS